MPKKKPRAAAKRRASRKTEPRPKPGSRDWQLALIDARAVESLLRAREVALPLETAAQIAGAPIETVEAWLDEGRRLRTLARRRAAMPYAELCRELADGWDAAVATIVMNLRTFLLEHAKRDPKTCIQVLTSYEREFLNWRRDRLLEQPEGLSHDRAEQFVPLELAMPGAGGGRHARFTRTDPDGSTTTAELSEQPFDAELRDHSEEDLEYYASHGRWPHEDAPPTAIDTDGEETEAAEPYPEIEEEIARLQAAGPPEPDVITEAPAPAPPPKQVVIKPPPLRKIDPQAALIELPGPEEIRSVEDPKKGIAPPAAPLRRIDPQRPP